MMTHKEDVLVTCMEGKVSGAVMNNNILKVTHAAVTVLIPGVHKDLSFASNHTALLNNVESKVNRFITYFFLNIFLKLM